jgi:hypothetical protein
MARDDQYAYDAKRNADTLESEISILEYSHYLYSRLQFGEFWEHANKIKELFKELKPLRREDRERLWVRYGAACEKAKKEKEQYYKGSPIKRSLIEGKIKDAVNAASDLTEAGIAEARRMLDEARAWMNDGWSGFSTFTQIESIVTGNEGALTKADRDACWEAWKEAQQYVWEASRIISS